ncbi:MAG: hypothetical protein ACRD7E_08665 [Bryobacteraceae bacterium]
MPSGAVMEGRKAGRLNRVGALLAKGQRHGVVLGFRDPSSFWRFSKRAWQLEPDTVPTLAGIKFRNQKSARNKTSLGRILSSKAFPVGIKGATAQ